MAKKKITPIERKRDRAIKQTDEVIETRGVGTIRRRTKKTDGTDKSQESGQNS